LSRQTSIKQAVAKVNAWVSDHAAGAQITYSPKNRVAGFDGVVIVLTPYLSYEVSAEDLYRHDGIKLLILNWTPQYSDERYEYHGPLVATFGPRRVQEAADAFMTEIRRRLPETRCEFIPHDPFEGIDSTIEVRGPYSQETDEGMDKLDELFAVASGVSETYGVRLHPTYKFEQPDPSVKSAG